MSYTIKLSNCAFYAEHGALPEEATLGQRFFVDVELLVTEPAALLSDAVADTVHYGEVFALVERIVTQTRRQLIETVAHDIVAAVLDQFARVDRVTATIRKPSVPIRGILDHAEVCVTRSRAP